MNDRVYFNSVANKWDSMHSFDEEKIKEILDISNIKEEAKILDVATGTGVLIKYLLEKMPRKIIAVDMAEKMIEVAKKKYSNKEVEFKAIDVMDYTEDGFDYIFLYSAYPHFKDKNRLINHLSSMLNKGGKLVIAHSNSREEINRIHKGKEEFKDAILMPIKDTVKVIEKYLDIDTYVDNSEMYYISAVRR